MWTCSIEYSLTVKHATRHAQEIISRDSGYQHGDILSGFSPHIVVINVNSIKWKVTSTNLNANTWMPPSSDANLVLTITPQWSSGYRTQQKPEQSLTCQRKVVKVTFCSALTSCVFLVPWFFTLVPVALKKTKGGVSTKCLLAFYVNTINSAQVFAVSTVKTKMTRQSYAQLMSISFQVYE